MMGAQSVAPSSRPRVLLISFPEGLGGPQRWLDDLLAEASIRQRIDLEVWRPEGDFRGVAGKLRLLSTLRRRLALRQFEWVYLALDLDLAAQLVLMLRLLGHGNVIVHSHAAGFCRNTPVRRKIYRKAVCLAKRKAAVSKVAANDMFGSKAADRVTIHPAYIEFGRLDEGENESGEERLEKVRSGKPYRFAFVGRLAAEKQPELAIKAFMKVADGIGDVTLDIVGDGPLMQACRKIAEAGNQGKSIRFHGRIDRVGTLLRERIDCVVVPSLFEGQCRVVAEAQFFGCAVISSKVVPREAFLDSTAVLTADPGRIEAWVEVMSEAAGSNLARSAWPLREAEDHPALGKHAGIRNFLELVAS